MSGVRLAAPEESQAVLIGVHEYEHLDQLPAVENNLVGLAASLRDQRIWGLPEENVTIVRQPKQASDIVDSVLDACKKTRDTLVVYYSGHGLIDREFTNQLYLALPRSQRHKRYTACHYEDILRELRWAGGASKRVAIILDCCFSARALHASMSAGEDLANLAAADLHKDVTEVGARCVLTASAATGVALAIPGETYTMFTGALIERLEKGIPGYPALLDMGVIYDQLRADIAVRSVALPTSETAARPSLPEFGSRGNPGKLCIAKNVAASESNPPQVPVPKRPVPRPRIHTGVPTHMADLVRDYLRRRAPVKGLYLVGTGPEERPLQRAREAHDLRPEEEVIAVWICKTRWIFAQENLAFTTHGIRIVHGKIHIDIPWVRLQEYQFSCGYRKMSGPSSVDSTGWSTDELYWLELVGPHKWSSLKVADTSPQAFLELLKYVQRLAAG